MVTKLASASGAHSRQSLVGNFIIRWRLCLRAAEAVSFARATGRAGSPRCGRGGRYDRRLRLRAGIGELAFRAAQDVGDELLGKASQKAPERQQRQRF
jgi:hypothetical protein